MPAARARPRNRTGAATERAFTLLELLVVLAVIGIAASLLFVSFEGGGTHLAEREARRLAGALEHAAALAQWSGETLGVSAEGRGYRFWRRGSNDAWVVVGDDDVLAPRTLSADLFVYAATYAGAPVAAGTILPFRPAGRNEPYAIALASPSGAFTIAADPLNRVEILRPAPGRDGSGP